jgi:hypothetical protein
MDSEFTSDVSEDGQAEELGEEKEW